MRRIERETGLTIVRAWSNGGYIFDFVTHLHQHGQWDKKTGDWTLITNPRHYTSCRDLFPA